MKAKLSKPGKEEEKIDAVVDMLAILIAQGCAYKNFLNLNYRLQTMLRLLTGNGQHYHVKRLKYL